MTVSCYKFIFCYSYVCVFLVGVFLYDSGLVNNSFLKALAVKGARVFFFSLQPSFDMQHDYLSVLPIRSILPISHLKLIKCSRHNHFLPSLTSSDLDQIFIQQKFIQIKASLSMQIIGHFFHSVNIYWCGVQSK